MDEPDKNDAPDPSVEEKVRSALMLKAGRHDAHYTDMELLGEGSFGVVHSANDSLLGRSVAIKSIKERYHGSDLVIERFIKEARGTAQLEHPNIMPVHEIGTSDRLGTYFTMKKVEGENLKEILERLKASPAFYAKSYPIGFLLEVFLSACNGVAFAHSRGVVHRDLKPANIMVGKYGEVLVLDWGLVKAMAESPEEEAPLQLRMDPSTDGVETLDGVLSGTPAYMPPEQAEGLKDEIDERSDVYSMGAILYHILTYHSPFERTDIRTLIDRVKKGAFISPRKRFPERKIPRELNAICLKAMSRVPINRYASVTELADDIRNYMGHREVSAYRAPLWLRLWNRCRRYPIRSSVAAAVCAVLLLGVGFQYAMQYGSYASNRQRADELRQQGHQLIDEASDILQELRELQSRLVLKETVPQEEVLRTELAHQSALAAARFHVAEALYESVPARFRDRASVQEPMIDIMRTRVEFALLSERYAEATQWLETIRTRVAQSKVDLTPAAMAWLDGVENRIAGKGQLTIKAHESIDEVIVWPLVDEAGRPRRMQGDVVERGSLPLEIASLAKGSYLLQITRTDGSIAAYPVFIAHGEHREVTPLLPPSVPEGMVYVPAGPFIFGGEESRFYREQTRTLPAFFIARHEVTVGEYLTFWQQLPDAESRSRYMSRIRFEQSERQYRNAWNEAGELIDPRVRLDLPVVGISRQAAEAFCRWKSRETRALIRLPSVEEWEKAARGVDGRRYVWGNGYEADANLALTKGNAKGKERYPYWAPPGSFSRDLSIYGAYDMAGNVREMTSTPLPDSETFYQLKGGSVFTPSNFLPCSYSSDTAVVPSDVGFRYVQEIDNATDADVLNGRGSE